MNPGVNPGEYDFSVYTTNAGDVNTYNVTISAIPPNNGDTQDPLEFLTYFIVDIVPYVYVPPSFVVPYLTPGDPLPEILVASDEVDIPEDEILDLFGDIS